MGKIKVGIIIVILIAMVGGYYFYLSNFRDTDEETVVTEVQDVLLKNLDTDYPPTPREVLKYYSDITKCLYNEKYTEDQLEQMADKMLALYDADLAENNPREEYIKRLKSDIDDFLKSGYTISTYTTSRSTEVEEYTSEGRKYAKLYCTYTIKSGAEYKTTQEVFVMRRDADTSRWKIFGFDVVNPEQSAQ